MNNVTTPSESLLRKVEGLPGYNAEDLPVEVAKAAIRALITPVADGETLPLDASLGRVLAEDIHSPIDVPGFDNSAMDGWALRSADLGDSETRLTEIGAAFAGHPFEGSVGPGQCVRIMTGAALPRGAVSVVKQESVRIEAKTLIIPAGEQPGQNVRHAGEDLKRDRVALAAGTTLHPAALGLIGSLGITQVSVYRKIRVAFFSTGDEVRRPNDHGDNGDKASALKPGQVYDSNHLTLRGMIERLGCIAIDLGVVGDDAAQLEAAFRRAAEQADVVITSGGVAAGDRDFTRPLAAKLGDVLFWKIAMRPGRPLAMGRIGSQDKAAWLFALPGNPVAVMVAFQQFVRGALLTLMGRRDVELPRLPVRAAHAMDKRPGRTEYQRGVLERKDGEWTVRLTGPQGSGILRSMVEANCMIVLAHERDSIQAGEYVEVMLFEGLV
jgi:molybdopterin molybdotransferase